MSAHTPGPWKVSDSADHQGGCVIVAVNGRMVAECYEDGEMQTGEDRANARVAAAALDMLAALREAEKECRLANLASDGSQKPNTPAARVIEICRAAIAKTGVQ
jgi:hypothetical protein